MKTRLITIKRTITVVDKDGKEQKVQKIFPVKINAGVPYDHRMCENYG